MWKCSIQGNGGTLMRRSKRPRSGVDVPTKGNSMKLAAGQR